MSHENYVLQRSQHTKKQRARSGLATINIVDPF